MDSFVSKTTGAIKGVKARIDGLSGVFRTLAEQHGEVSALLMRQQGNADDRTLWPEIRKQLLSHERAELREVYPVLAEHADLVDFCEQHAREARELEALIDKLDVVTADQRWSDLFDELCDRVMSHADEEEKDIFPRAQQIIGSKGAADLDVAFKATQKEILAMA